MAYNKFFRNEKEYTVEVYVLHFCTKDGAEFVNHFGDDLNAAMAAFNKLPKEFHKAWIRMKYYDSNKNGAKYQWENVISR